MGSLGLGSRPFSGASLRLPIPCQEPVLMRAGSLCPCLIWCLASRREPLPPSRRWLAV